MKMGVQNNKRISLVVRKLRQIPIKILNNMKGFKFLENRRPHMKWKYQCWPGNMRHATKTRSQNNFPKNVFMHPHITTVSTYLRLVEMLLDFLFFWGRTKAKKLFKAFAQTLGKVKMNEGLLWQKRYENLFWLRVFVACLVVPGQHQHFHLTVRGVWNPRKPTTSCKMKMPMSILKYDVYDKDLKSKQYSQDSKLKQFFQKRIHDSSHQHSFSLPKTDQNITRHLGFCSNLE